MNRKELLQQPVAALLGGERPRWLRRLPANTVAELFDDPKQLVGLDNLFVDAYQTLISALSRLGLNLYGQPPLETRIKGRLPEYKDPRWLTRPIVDIGLDPLTVRDFWAANRSGHIGVSHLNPVELVGHLVQMTHAELREYSFSSTAVVDVRMRLSDIGFPPQTNEEDTPHYQLRGTPHPETPRGRSEIVSRLQGAENAVHAILEGPAFEQVFNHRERARLSYLSAKLASIAVEIIKFEGGPNVMQRLHSTGFVRTEYPMTPQQLSAVLDALGDGLDAAEALAASSLDGIIFNSGKEVDGLLAETITQLETFFMPPPVQTSMMFA